MVKTGPEERGKGCGCLIALGLIIGLFALITIFSGGGEKKKPAVKTGEVREERKGLETLAFEESDVREYKILETKTREELPILLEDFDRYTKRELEEMKPELRMEYDLLIPSNISLSEFKATVKKFITVETTNNLDIDSVAARIYDKENSDDDPYSTVYWAPNGRLGGVTPEIAETNNRSSYKVNFLFIRKWQNLN